MKILIVDDEKPARDRLSRMVGEINAHELVGEAVNGLEALGLAQSLEPDIVLLDIRMPGMDGIEAARHIAKLDEPPAVIFTTAFSDHALEAFETHAVDYLLKPVDDGRLISGSKDGTVPVRMMLPFSLQCSTCHTFLYRGRKFNSKKEPMGGPDGKYLGRRLTLAPWAERAVRLPLLRIGSEVVRSRRSPRRQENAISDQVFDQLRQSRVSPWRPAP